MQNKKKVLTKILWDSPSGSKWLHVETKSVAPQSLK